MKRMILILALVAISGFAQAQVTGFRDTGEQRDNESVYEFQKEARQVIPTFRMTSTELVKELQIVDLQLQIVGLQIQVATLTGDTSGAAELADQQAGLISVKADLDQALALLAP